MFARRPDPFSAFIRLEPVAVAAYTAGMRVEVESEDDGRYIAEVPSIPGAMVYGATANEAIMKVEALVLRILADRIESGEDSPELTELFTVSA